MAEEYINKLDNSKITNTPNTKFISHLIKFKKIFYWKFEGKPIIKISNNKREKNHDEKFSLNLYVGSVNTLLNLRFQVWDKENNVTERASKYAIKNPFFSCSMSLPTRDIFTTLYTSFMKRIPD